MDSLNLQDIMQALGPQSEPGLLWNILMYVIFFFTLITMLVQGDKALMPTMVAASALLMDIVAKLQVFPPREFGSFVINAGVFILPALVAGMAKNGKARGPAIIASVFGAIWFFGYWFVFQR